MSTVAKLLARLELDTSGFQKGLGSIPNMLSRVGGDFSQIGGAITNSVTIPLLAVGAAAAAVSGHAIKIGVDFEKAMSGVNAILGSSQEEMQRLSDMALKLGMDPNLIVTASQAAGAMEELAKNGLTATEILGGAAEAAIALANATGTDFATAAAIASTSLQLFNIEANEMNRVVNAITAGANSSRFTAEDFAMAIGMGGGMAQAVGVTYEDFITTIAGLSNSFSSGSDAGTSFKTFLQRLAPDTKPAIEAMRELGIITEEGQNQFFDANGELKSMAEVAEVLQNALSGLTDEQKILALTNIFGTDALRTANAMAELGAEGFNDLAASMGKVDAAANAATRMDNLAGTFEILGGVIEAFEIKFTKAIGPGIRTAVQSFTQFLADNSTQIDNLFVLLGQVFTDFGNNMGPWLEQNGPKMIAFFEKLIEALPLVVGKLAEVVSAAGPGLGQLFDTFMQMDPNTIVAIVQALGTLAVLGPVISTLGTIITSLGSIASLVSGLGPIFTTAGTMITSVLAFLGSSIFLTVILPLLAIIATLALVVYAFATDFGGITTTVAQLGFIIKFYFEQAAQWIMTNIQEASSFFQAKFQEMMGIVNALQGVFNAAMSGIAAAISMVISKVAELAAKLMGIKIPEVLTPGSPTPFENGLRGILDAMESINNTGLGGLSQGIPSPAGVASPRSLRPSYERGVPTGSAQTGAPTIIIHNPKKESSEESIRKTLNRLSYLRTRE